MQPASLSPSRLALLIAAILISGVALGGIAGSFGAALPPASPAGEATGAPTPSPAATLPAADAGGEDLARLPRYPGAVRTAYEVTRDAHYNLTMTEYLVDAEIDDVRVYYQGVIVEHGWERADIGFDRGEWSYVLVDGGTEAFIEIEELGGLIEIDLQVSEPLADPPAATPAPESIPAPTPAPALPPPPPTDDDGDDDDGDDDDGDDDDDDGGGDDGGSGDD